jgi:hypothetical protein
MFALANDNRLQHLLSQLRLSLLARADDHVTDGGAWQTIETTSDS